ncbi:MULTISPECIES: acyl-CoA dehydrogenase [unclassified Sphingomonas]|uniref:acyl-CoA dehydrogenase n=1 Tax=unclassified Sphingomonas TaxID=196159 RepID=UPI000B05AE65|nr:MULTISPECIES: acyl-CoA dehydrogenase [unclassified Sphingomonas]
MIDLAFTIGEQTRALRTLHDPSDQEALLHLLRVLFAAGRKDLPLGRLFEGQVDALQIVSRYGSAEQRTRLVDAVAAGGIVGVWNADLPGKPLVLKEGRLEGGKSFASGAGMVTHALVTVEGNGGRQLILVDLVRTPPTIDRKFWQVIGMQRSETHIVCWDGDHIRPNDLIGQPGDYVREPWFSGGAMRFAAVQAGGIAALVDQTRDHLVATGRTDDPHQAGRLADLYGLAETASGSVRNAAKGWFGDETTRLPLVSAARTAVYDAGGRALALAQEAVGVSALFVSHPLAATITDLSMYLRQPGPDAQRMRVGAAVASGVLNPSL